MCMGGNFDGRPQGIAPRLLGAERRHCRCVVFNISLCVFFLPRFASPGDEFDDVLKAVTCLDGSVYLV